MIVLATCHMPESHKAHSRLQTVRESLEKYERMAEERAHEAGEDLAWIILDLSPVPEIDATAVHYWCAAVKR